MQTAEDLLLDDRCLFDIAVQGQGVQRDTDKSNVERPGNAILVSKDYSFSWSNSGTPQARGVQS